MIAPCSLAAASSRIDSDMTSNERRDSAEKMASDDSRDSSSWVHRFAATAASHFDLALRVTRATSSNAAFIAAVAGSLTVSIDQGRAQPEIVPRKPADDGSCGPHVRHARLDCESHFACCDAKRVRSRTCGSLAVPRGCIRYAVERHACASSAPRIYGCRRCATARRARHTSLTLTSRPPMTRAQIYRF